MMHLTPKDGRGQRVGRAETRAGVSFCPRFFSFLFQRQPRPKKVSGFFSPGSLEVWVYSWRFPAFSKVRTTYLLGVRGVTTGRLSPIKKQLEQRALKVPFEWLGEETPHPHSFLRLEVPNRSQVSVWLLGVLRLGQKVCNLGWFLFGSPGFYSGSLMATPTRSSINDMLIWACLLFWSPFCFFSGNHWEVQTQCELGAAQ